MKLQPGSELSGIGIGDTAVRAEVFRLKARQRANSSTRVGTATDETARLLLAIDSVANDLDQLTQSPTAVNADILEALAQLVRDPELLRVATSHIETGMSAVSAITAAVEEFAALLSGDSFLEERANDLRELGMEVVAKLNGFDAPQLPNNEIVIVTEDLSPADLARLGSNVVGVVLQASGPTSHTAIMLRSMGLPAVIGCSGASQLVDGQQVLVDPAGDRVLVDAELSLATRAITLIAKNSKPLIPVRANVGSLSEAIRAATTSASGVGLLRTELLYLTTTRIPTTAEQTESYREMFTASPEGPIVVRTIDVSTDKPVPFLNSDYGDLVSPGYTLLRDNRAFLAEQLASIEGARLASGREVWVMAPMIQSSAEALDFARLARSCGQFRVGVMVEVPNLIPELEDLANEIDFVSVGTNDLSQFLFETNRLAPLSPELLSPWQPKLISALREIAEHCTAIGLLSSVCGESASDPLFAIVLAGLGFDSVSTANAQVAAVTSSLSAVSELEAAGLAALALSANSAAEAKANVLAGLRDLGLGS